jgi:hypothetical protein
VEKNILELRNTATLRRWRKPQVNRTSACLPALSALADYEPGCVLAVLLNQISRAVPAIPGCWYQHFPPGIFAVAALSD